MWVIHFVQERFHNISSHDSKCIFIKVGDSEAKEGCRVQEATGESLGGALLCLSRNITGQK